MIAGVLSVETESCVSAEGSGGAEVVFTSAIPDQIQYTGLGHLHRTQNLKEHSGSVNYSGSILEYSFSEAYQTKHVLVAEIEPGERPIVKKIPLVTGRQLHRKKFEQISDAISWLRENPKVFVELTLVSDTFLDASVKRQLNEVHDGIISIIPELKAEFSTESTNRDINLSKPTEELFAEYFAFREGTELNESMKDLFSEILNKE